MQHVENMSEEDMVEWWRAWGEATPIASHGTVALLDPECAGTSPHGNALEVLSRGKTAIAHHVPAPRLPREPNVQSLMCFLEL